MGYFPRKVVKSGLTLSGLKIKKGDTINLYPISNSFDEENFPDPYKFDPTRFVPDLNPDHPKISKTTFNPFGRGARVCLGKQLGELQIYLLTIELLREFKVSKATEDWKPNLGVLPTYSVQNGTFKLELI